MGAQNFNFAPEFPQNGGGEVSAPKFAFLDKNFSTGIRLYDNILTS